MASGGGGGGAAVPPSPTATKSKKSKKKGGAKAKANGDAAAATNGHKSGDGGDESAEQRREEEDAAAENGGEGVAEGEAASKPTELPLRSPTATQSKTGDAAPAPPDGAAGQEAAARLQALEQEHVALQDEAARLRTELEEAGAKHASELADSQGAKEKAEADYQTLVGRVNQIKSQLGERLREDAEELSQTRARIEELEAANATLATQDSERAAELAQLAEENEAQSKELSGLRNRSTLSNATWERERDELVRREAEARDEFSTAKQAMQDWEILAMEERSIRENLAERAAELEEQATTHREARERLEAERATQGATVDGLQRALQELQEARKRELREVVENSQAQLDSIRKELEQATERADKASATQEGTQAELERLLPLEAEVKEKNLLIGKLRHQAVGLNDHLTRAMRQISRKGKPEDNISRELVTNHLLQFLTLERSDPRKFQILQILASILDWNEDQQERAGLARPGASNPNLRAPISPWHRTPSTPSLAALDLDKQGRVDSMGSAFAEFLEKESESGTPRTQSRSPSSDRK